MICHLCDRALFMHAHGELGGLERFLLQCHLEGCDGCRGRWAKAVVEKDQLRRALSPVPTLDPEGERRLQVIGARIRTEQRPIPASSTPVAPTGRATARPAGSRGRRFAGLALATALLAITLTAMAAAWAPSLGVPFRLGATAQAPPGGCPPRGLCARCQLEPPNAPAVAGTSGACEKSPANAPAVGAGKMGTPPVIPAGATATPKTPGPGSGCEPPLRLPVPGSVPERR